MKTYDDGLWLDSPIESEEHDSFDRLTIAKNTAGLLNGLSQNNESSVIAYIGPWGCGKTSLINMTIKELEKDKKNWRVAYFSPWATNDIEGMANEFYSALISALSEKETKNFPKKGIGKFRSDKIFNTAKKPLAKLVRTVESVVSLGATNPVIDAVIKCASKFTTGMLVEKLEKDKTWINMFKELNDKFRKLEYNIIIIADDIDRLQEDELKTFFKLIRLIGNLPNVYYLIAYDNDSLVRALSGSFSSEYNSVWINKYIEKFVQFPVYVPPISEHKLEKYINDRLKYRNLKVYSMLDSAFHHNLSIFVDFLDTPRSLIRFLNQFELAISDYEEGEINYSDLLIITLIKFHFPEIYFSIYKNKHILTLNRRNYSDHKNVLDDLFKLVERVVNNDEVKIIEMILLLSTIFPILRHWCMRPGVEQYNNLDIVQELSNDNRLLTQNGGVLISNPLVFRRYFKVGLDQYSAFELKIESAIEHAKNEEYFSFYSLIMFEYYQMSNSMFDLLSKTLKRAIDDIDENFLSVIVSVMFKWCGQANTPSSNGKVDYARNIELLSSLIILFMKRLDSSKPKLDSFEKDVLDKILSLKSAKKEKEYSELRYTTEGRISALK